jgi:hypothetical protein
MKPIASSVLLSLLALAPHLGATTLLVDFGNNGSNGIQTSSPDTHGSYWNNSFNGGYTVTDMVTRTNVATTIDLSYITPVTTNSAALSVTSAPSPFNTASAYQDAIFTTGTTAGTGITLRLAQLDASKTYIFTLFGSRNATDSRTTNFSISGGSTVTGSLQTSGTNLGGTGINHNISNTLVLGGISGIAPNGSNQIDVTLFANLADASDFGYLNAMQVTVIPESATALLGGLGMLALLRRRRSH